MKKLFLSVLLIGSLTLTLNAENNDTTKTKSNTENNTSTKAKENSSTKAKKAEEQIQEQMKKEEKYAKEQTFYQGKNYDLSDHEVDPNSLSDIPDIEPDYEFDMDDVYD